MKYFAVIAAMSLCGCVAGGETSDVQDLGWEGAMEETPAPEAIPQAAVEIMAKVGGTSSAAPQFFSCPPYMTYLPSAMNESGYIYDWNNVEIDVLPVSTVEWVKFGSAIHIRCKAYSPHSGMYVRKIITGFSTCTTSNDTPQNDGAWFVCF